MAVAKSARLMSGNKIIESLIAEYGNLRIEQRAINIGAIPVCIRRSRAA